jgi:hypothetical protein
MRLAALMIFSSALGACAASTVDVRSRAPLRTYASAGSPSAISRCLVQRVRGASVVPDGTESMVDVQNRASRPSVAWEIAATRTGSLITVWSSNPRAPGVAQAEACF